MSLKDCDTTFKLIADLMPRYDGNPKLLNNYIREVENILKLLKDEHARSHPALNCLIKSRLSGTAIDALAYEEYLDTWDTIRNALTRRLREPCNEIQVMQELTRTRRSKQEDAETFGKRLRELLDTLLSICRHDNKSYYENMFLEQYINQLYFHVSLGVRIAKPDTLELAIIAARQEEAKLAYKRVTYFSTPSTSQAKPRELMKLNSYLPYSNFSNPYIVPTNLALHMPQPPFSPNNSAAPDQRQQWVQPMQPWKSRPTPGNFRTGGSGTFRSGNFS